MLSWTSIVKEPNEIPFETRVLFCSLCDFLLLKILRQSEGDRRKRLPTSLANRRTERPKFVFCCLSADGKVRRGEETARRLFSRTNIIGLLRKCKKDKMCVWVCEGESYNAKNSFFLFQVIFWAQRFSTSSFQTFKHANNVHFANDISLNRNKILSFLPAKTLHQ